MKKKFYLLSILFLMSIFSGKVFAAPSFPPGIYQVVADEDSGSSSFYFEINDPEPGSYDRLSGSVTGINLSILSSVTVQKFVDLGGGFSMWRLFYTPVTDKIGTNTLTVTITDGTNSASRNMTITITPLNDAPILHNGGNDVADMYMPDITDTDTTTATVQEIINSSPINGGNAITDVDGDREGIAIIGVNSSFGKWEYSIGGGSWMTIGNVSETHALLLDITDRVRFTRNAGWSGIIPNGLRIKAWDHSDARASGTYTDTTNYAGIAPPRDQHPYSTNTELVSIKACPTLNIKYCYSVDSPSNSLTSMVNGNVGNSFTAGTFNTTYGQVTIQPNGNFTYTKGPNFTCADQFNFTVSPGGGCPALNGTAFVLQPICTSEDLRIDLEDAIRALQIVSGVRPSTK